MSSWSRIKQSKLKSYLHQFKRCYLLIPHYSSLNYTTSNSSTYAFAKNHFVNPKRPTEFCNYPRFFAAPAQAKPKQEAKDKSGPRLNEKITANFVRLVLPEGGHNIVSRNEALQRARKLKLDLVEVQRTADPPVCKIMDFHREKYKQQVKEKDRSKSKSEVTLKKGECKEVRFSAKTEQKDLQMKADTVKRLMERGYRVKCMVMGTEDQDLGGLLSRLTELIEDVSVVESGPRAEKRQAYAIVRHMKFGPSKKGPAKKASKLMGAASNEVQKGVTAPPTIEPCSPGQAPLQFEEDLTSAGSGFETDDESISDDVDPRPDKSIGEKRTTWSVLDTSEDFDKLFDLSDEKGVTSHSTVGEMATAPEKASSLLSTPPKPLLDLENSYKRSEPRDNNPPATMENRGRRAGDSVRLEHQFPSPGKLPLLDLNVSSADPSYGTFSTVPKASAGHNGVAGEIRRNSEGKSFDSTGPVKLESGFQFRNLNRPPNEDPKHEQPHSGASKSAAPSYGIFSAHGKQSTTEEINREKIGNPFDSERKANPGGSATSGSPASNSEGSQRPGGWGIFSREKQA